MKKYNVFEHVARAMNLENEPEPGKPLIEIVGDHSVLIENHTGVFSYSEEQVKIRTKIGCICIIGNGLVLRKMSKEQLKICGLISKIELCGRH